MFILLKFFQKIFYFWFLFFSSLLWHWSLCLLTDSKVSPWTPQSFDGFFFCNSSSSDEKKKSIAQSYPSSSRAKDWLQESFEEEEDAVSPELIDWINEFEREEDERMKEEVFKLLEKGEEKVEKVMPMKQKQKVEGLVDIESDSEDLGWRDPFEEDYDDADYEALSEEEWPEDERPLQSPRLNNPPRVAPSEKKKLFYKSNDGRDYLPWEDRRDFWALLRRRNGLSKKQWEQMQAHIEKYAPEWEKWDEESRKKKDGDKT